MANHAYITMQEQSIIDAKQTIEATRQAFTIEQGKHEGQSYPENRDCWGTLWANACALHSELDRLLTAMGKEFGR